MQQKTQNELIKFAEIFLASFSLSSLVSSNSIFFYFMINGNVTNLISLQF